MLLTEQVKAKGRLQRAAAGESAVKEVALVPPVHTVLCFKTKAEYGMKTE